jgi:hypothetical protein
LLVHVKVNIIPEYDHPSSSEVLYLNYDTLPAASQSILDLFPVFVVQNMDNNFSLCFTSFITKFFAETLVAQQTSG